MHGYEDYWNARQDLEYYRLIQSFLARLGPQESILDVGCADTPVVTWGQFQRRTSLDRFERPPLPNVTPLIGTWPAAAATIGRHTVVTCLQVLEHLQDPASFAQAVLDAAESWAILSVPYRWPAGQCSDHFQDPVDVVKLLSWTRQRPDRIQISRDTSPRLIAYYRTSRVCF